MNLKVTVRTKIPENYIEA